MFSYIKYIVLFATIPCMAMDDSQECRMKEQLTIGFTKLASFPFANYAATLRSCYPNGIDNSLFPAAVKGVLSNFEDQEVERKISFLTQEMKVNVNCDSGTLAPVEGRISSLPLLFDITHNLLEAKKYSHTNKQIKILLDQGADPLYKVDAHCHSSLRLLAYYSLGAKLIYGVDKDTILEKHVAEINKIVDLYFKYVDPNEVAKAKANIAARKITK